MPGEIRAGSGALLHHAGLELGRFAEKDRSRAGAADGLGHASDDREGNERRHINGKQEVHEGEQPEGRRIRPNPNDKLHHISRCQQPLRMGNELAFAEERLSLEAGHADRRADNKDEAEFEEGLDTGGGPRIPCTLARRPQ